MAAREKILIALSGGVDSAVAALLLRDQGHSVVGAYMKNWINEDGVIGDCPWEQDIADARAVAGHLGIEFRVVNLMADYRRLVVDYLLDGYQRGLTPNPDVMCNREIKFGVLLRYAQAEGFAAVATGHYAQRQSLATGGWGLFEGVDPNKDQSYFLALLTQEQLRAARFPIGRLTKPDVRRLAADAGLPNARKKDSQGICFIGRVKIHDFLQAYVPEQPGPVIRVSDGRVLGEHRGLHYYTIGQRKGIGIPSNTDHKAYVVVGKRAVDRALLVAFDEPAAPGLWTTTASIHSLSFLGAPIAAPARLEARVRYRDPRVPIEFYPDVGRDRPIPPDRLTPPSAAMIKFAQPQRALAPGQILALYRGPQLLGGAIFS